MVHFVLGLQLWPPGTLGRGYRYPYRIREKAEMGARMACLDEAGRRELGGQLEPTPFWPEVSPSRLHVLNGTKRRIGIIRLWPKQAAAEHESIERYRAAAKLIGVDIVEVDRLGFLIWGPRRKVSRDDVDFVISLHFETPKSYDCFSFGALWNPIDFYVDWGADTFIDHQFTHDAYFTCGSRPIERLLEAEMARGGKMPPLVQVNHTLSGPVYKPEERVDRRLVYCGINWERLSKKAGRFDKLLEPLDERGVLDIFGPERVQDVRVWEGFKGYKHEVPFDGISLTGEIARSGAVLALSSNAHLRSGVMTSRLFEGAAAGALVFADDNTFVAKNFADEVVPIELTGDGKRDARQIVEKLGYYNRYPEEALAIANRLQAKYLDAYTLHEQLLDAYAVYMSRESIEPACNVATVSYVLHVVLWLEDGEAWPEQLVADIKRQSFGRHSIVVITNQSISQEEVRHWVEAGGDAKLIRVSDRYGETPNPIGMFLCDAVEKFGGGAQFVALHAGAETLFHDYSARMIGGLAEGDIGAVCGTLVRHYDPARKQTQNEEFIEYRRPCDWRRLPKCTLSNVLLRKQWMLQNSGWLQYLNYDGVRTALTQAFDALAIVDAPLVSADLKVYERYRRIHEHPFSADKFAEALARCGKPGAAQEGVTIAMSGGAISLKQIEALSLGEQRAIIVQLLKSLPIPRWIQKIVGWILRRFSS